MVDKGEKISNALARRLPLNPQLKVLKSVIESVAILVVNVLPTVQRPAKGLLHHQAMLQDFSIVRLQQFVAIWSNRSGSPFPALFQTLGATARLVPVFVAESMAEVFLAATRSLAKARRSLFGMSTGLPDGGGQHAPVSPSCVMSATISATKMFTQAPIRGALSKRTH